MQAADFVIVLSDTFRFFQTLKTSSHPQRSFSLSCPFIVGTIGIIVPHLGIMAIVVPHKGIMGIIVPYQGIICIIVPHLGTIVIIVPHLGIMAIVAPHLGIMAIVVPHLGIMAIVAPTIMRSQVQIPSKPSTLFLICIIEIVMRKERK